MTNAFPFYDHLESHFNNDSIDQLNHIITPIILLNFALIHWFRFFIQDPFICLSDASHIDAWYSFINQYCFTERKFFISPDVNPFPRDETIRYSTPIKDYHWVTLVFLFQAVFATIPFIFWEFYNYESGIMIRPITAALTRNVQRSKKVLGEENYFEEPNSDDVDDDDDEEEGDTVEFLLDVLKHNSLRKLNNNKYYGFIPPQAYISFVYICYKALNIIFVIAQLIFLNYFLNTNYKLWGIGILMDLMKGVDWKISGRFPRYVFCDFNRRDDSTGNPFRSTSQCLLPFNWLNEMMFIGIWFWLSFTLLANILNFFHLFYFLTNRMNRIKFIETLLAHHSIDRSNPKFDYFVDNVLGKDGVLLMRILCSNVTRHAVSDFVHEIWMKEAENPSDAFKEKDRTQ